MTDPVLSDRLSLHPLLQTIRGYCTDEVPYVVLDGLLSSAVGRAKLLEAEIERLTQDLRIARFDADVPIREPREENERLRAALRQAEIRLFQIDRDRRERDKVFATAATARAEIARGLDEREETP